jgi:hypothetical protein
MAVTASITANSLPSPGNPPPGCYVSEQARLNAYASALAVVFTNLNNAQIVIAKDADFPPVSTDYLVLRTDATPPNPISVIYGLYAAAGGNWVPVDRQNFYTGVNDTSSTVNSFVVSAPANPKNYTYKTGDVWLFKPAATNTGPSTFQVGSLASASIYKGGTTPLVGGDIQSGLWTLIMWDGTQFQLISAPQSNFLPVQRVYATSGPTTEVNGTQTLSLNFTLPSGAKLWTDVELYAMATLDSQSAGLGTGSIIFKWNTAPLTATQVVTSATSGASNQGQVIAVDNNAIDSPTWNYVGEVPSSIATSTTLQIQAILTLTNTGGSGLDYREWNFWAVARCK